MYLPTGDRGCDRFIGRLPGITNHGPVFLLLLGLKLGKGYGNEGEIEICTWESATPCTGLSHAYPAPCPRSTPRHVPAPAVAPSISHRRDGSLCPGIPS